MTGLEVVISTISVGGGNGIGIGNVGGDDYSNSKENGIKKFHGRSVYFLVLVIRVVVYFTTVLQQYTLIPVVFCLRVVVIYLCFSVFFFMIDLNLLVLLYTFLN